VPSPPARAATPPDRVAAAVPPPDEPPAAEPEPPGGDPGLPAPAPHSSLRAGLADRLPLTLRGAVLEPTRRALLGLAVLLVSAVALAAFLVWWTRPSDTAVPAVHRQPAPPGVVSSKRPVPASASAPASVVVHVAGAVRRPGLVELPGGSRVADAVDAAGGPTAKADLASVNLARTVVDGEQLVVLRHGQAGGAVAGPAGATGPAPSGGDSPAGAPLDLNTATLQQLDGLPGVGPVLAQRIVDWRTEHGRFTSVDELTEVSGIGERTLADLRSGVRV
jgi:competence protein ComEA